MAKRYDQYCPVAHALGLIGERWSLLVVLELMHGPKRYTDLVEALPGIGTNILATRLRDLERGGVIAKRLLMPPAASRVYELTEYGQGLRPAIRELALWGARSLGPPTAGDELCPGWLVNALDAVATPQAPPGRFQFRIGDELAAVVDGEVQAGAVEQPDVVVEGGPVGFYQLFVERRLDAVAVEGDASLLEALLAAAPARREQAAAA